MSGWYGGIRLCKGHAPESGDSASGRPKPNREPRPNWEMLVTLSPCSAPTPDLLSALLAPR